VPASHAEAASEEEDFALAARSLSSLLAADAQDALPEVLRPRPKFYHYYRWTTKRIKVRKGKKEKKGTGERTKKTRFKKYRVEGIFFLSFLLFFFFSLI